MYVGLEKSRTVLNKARAMLRRLDQYYVYSTPLASAAPFLQLLLAFSCSYGWFVGVYPSFTSGLLYFIYPRSCYFEFSLGLSLTFMEF